MRFWVRAPQPAFSSLLRQQRRTIRRARSSPRVTNSSGAPVAGAAVTHALARSEPGPHVHDQRPTATSRFGPGAGRYAINVVASGYHPYDDTLTVTAAQQSQVTVGLVSVTQTSSRSSLPAAACARLRRAAPQASTSTSRRSTPTRRSRHDITSITLLAPTVQRGVSGFAQANGEDVPTIGGSSVAENAYYINGLNITNPDTYVGSARVPFYFYKNVDVQTGGYTAEFGRATGGVINATTKSGTNVPFLAMHIDWEPASLRAPSEHRHGHRSDEIGRTVKPITSNDA